MYHDDSVKHGYNGHDESFKKGDDVVFLPVVVFENHAHDLYIFI